MLRTILVVALMIQVALCFPQDAHEESSDSATVKYRKEVHVSAGNQPGLFDAIFQIPIQTLKAVNHLVNQAAVNGSTYTKKVVVTNAQHNPTGAANVVYSKRVYSTDTANGPAEAHGSTEDNEIIKQAPPANGPPANEQESSTVRYVKEYRVRNPSNGFFDAIFQIPIQTLAAVNNLVNKATGNSYRKEIRINAGVDTQQHQ